MMRWTHRIAAWVDCADERFRCGRESAWSWRPDAGAKSTGDDPERRRWL